MKLTNRKEVQNMKKDNNNEEYIKLTTAIIQMLTAGLTLVNIILVIFFK